MAKASGETNPSERSSREQSDQDSGDDELDLRGEPAAHDVDLTGQAILVVDDEVDIRKLVRVILSSSDLPISHIEDAVDGKEALDALPRLRRQYESVVVLLDKQLPDLDGLEVAKMMLERDPAEVIVLFTAYLTDEVREEAVHLGITACVTKTAVRTLPAVVSVLLAGPEAATEAISRESEA